MYSPIRAFVQDCVVIENDKLRNERVSPKNTVYGRLFRRMVKGGTLKRRERKPDVIPLAMIWMNEMEGEKRRRRTKGARRTSVSHRITTQQKTNKEIKCLYCCEVSCIQTKIPRPESSRMHTSLRPMQMCWEEDDRGKTWDEIDCSRSKWRHVRQTIRISLPMLCADDGYP